MSAYGIILDLDGVIVSTDKYHFLAWKHISEKNNLKFDRHICDKLRESSWRTISWREGTKGELKKQFAFVDAYWSTLGKTGLEGCIVFERPILGEDGDIKYYFSNLPDWIPNIKLVEYVHRR